MNDQNLLRGIFLIAIALLFGVSATRYELGTFSHAGPGLFPLLVSTLLLLIGLVTLLRARFIERVPLGFNLKNVGLVVGSLCGFAWLSQHLDMAAGIVFLVFCSAFAGISYSVLRNLKLVAVLIGFAFALQQLLGLNLPLF